MMRRWVPVSCSTCWRPAGASPSGPRTCGTCRRAPGRTGTGPRGRTRTSSAGTGRSGSTGRGRTRSRPPRPCTPAGTRCSRRRRARASRSRTGCPRSRRCERPGPARSLDPGRIESARRRPTVLYLSPTKALAADQLASVERLLAASGVRDVRAATCDGDTSRDERRWVREHADVVLTNPDLLHHAVLPQHRTWSRLVGSLAYVVVDECHAFRGVFGAHVGLVLRRLRRVAASYGAAPVMVMASATTGDPATSAARLVGVAAHEVHAVTADASPAGRKTFVLWQPPELPGGDGPWSALVPDDDPWAGVLQVPARGDTAPGSPGAPGPGGADPADDDPAGTGLPDPDVAGPGPEPVDPEGSGPQGTGERLVAVRTDRPRRTATAEVADLLADLVAAGARTLAFVRSRRGAESVATTDRRCPAAVTPRSWTAVSAYRGGYLPEERRALEAARCAAASSSGSPPRTRSSSASTSPGSTPWCVGGLSGHPGVVVAAGRAGGPGRRRGAGGARGPRRPARHLPRAPPRRPARARRSRRRCSTPSNPYVLAPHLCCGAAELPLRAEDAGPVRRRGRDAVLDELARGECCAAGRRAGSGRAPSRPPARWTCAGRAGSRCAWSRRRPAGCWAPSTPRPRRDASTPARCTCTGARATSSTTCDLDDGLALVHAADAGLAHGRPVDADVDRGRGRRAPRPAARCVGLGEVNVTTQVIGLPAAPAPDGEVLETVPLDMPRSTLAPAPSGTTSTTTRCSRAGLSTAPDPRRAARRRARRDRAAAAVRDLRPLGHRRDVDGRAPDTGLPDGLRPRRAPRWRRVRRARARGAAALAARDPGRDRRLRVPRRLPVVRAVAQVRQRQRPARQARGAPAARPPCSRTPRRADAAPRGTSHRGVARCRAAVVPGPTC